MSEIRSNFLKKYNNYLAPEAVVWIDGEKLSALGLYFTSLEVDKSLDGADTFSFSLSDAIDLEFKSKHSQLFELGNKVEIHMGYADSNREKADLSMLFIGLITNVNWNFGEENYLDITVEGQDYSFLLMKHSYSQPIQEESISNIVQKVIDEVYQQTFSDVNIDSTKVIYKQVQNQEENDYLFFKSLAKKIGYEFYIEKENLFFRTPPQNQESRLTLYYGQELLSFKPELNVEKEVSKVRVVGLEFSADNQTIVAEATLERDETFSESDSGIKALLRKLNAVEYEVREAVSSVEEATQRAEALLQSFSLNFFKAEITSIGIPELKPGITISLEGLGKRFSRDYYVEKTVHSISEQGYETTISVRGSSSSFSLLEESRGGSNG